MAERKSRSRFPFDRWSYKCTTVAYANKKFNLHSEYSLMKAGTEAQECKKNINCCDVTEVDVYYKEISNKKEESKSYPYFNTVDNVMGKTTGKKVISRSVPTLKCVPMVPDVERRFYRIVRRRKDNEDAADDVMEGFMGCLRWTGYACGCYIGIGAFYLGMLQIPMLGPGMESYGLGFARPLFSPIGYVFGRATSFLRCPTTRNQVNADPQEVSEILTASGPKNWVWSLLECFYFTSEHVNEDVGSWELPFAYD